MITDEPLYVQVPSWRSVKREVESVHARSRGSAELLTEDLPRSTAISDAVIQLQCGWHGDRDAGKNECLAQDCRAVQVFSPPIVWVCQWIAAYIDTERLPVDGDQVIFKM
jgi:hypothetical protein